MEPLKSFKPRKAHRKSRDGCKACRRRKIKCDEAKPVCRTCVIREEECEYGRVTPQQQSQGVSHQTCTQNTEPTRLALAVGQMHLASVSPAQTSISGSSSAHTSPPNYLAAGHGSPSQKPDIPYSDLSLFDHYLRHTCHASGLSRDYAYARRIGMPTLASKSKGVLYSILAFGAACFCVDLLLGPDPLAATDQITHLIKTGDRYHGKALATIRSQLGAKSPEELDIAHALTAMLMGYAPARRRIFRLLRRQRPSPALVEKEPDADAPYNLDWAFFMRGLKTVAKARDDFLFQGTNDEASPGGTGRDVPDVVLSTYVAQAVELEREQVERLSPCTNSASTHRDAMRSVISSSVSKALDTLYEQLNILELKIRDQHCGDIWSTSFEGLESHSPSLSSLTACYSAITMLTATAVDTFDLSPSPGTGPPTRSRSHYETMGRKWFSLNESHWLHDFNTPQAEEAPPKPATQGVFTWIGHTPKEFMDIIVARYPERSDNGTLTVEQQIQCLAWDIYAHWLVFTFSMEDDLWWWADMGRSDIEKLRDTLPKPNENGYSVEVGIHNWWPWQMWSLAKELRIKKHEADAGVDS